MRGVLVLALRGLHPSKEIEPSKRTRIQTTRTVVAECCCVVLLVGVEHHPERTVCGSVVGVRARVVVRLLHLLLDCGQVARQVEAGERW